MSDDTVFDRETLLDAAVNGVPLVIVLAGAVAFVVAPAWSAGSLGGVVAVGFLLVTAVALVAVTVLGARAIEK